MSKMAELAYDIEQLYIEGYSPKSIALMLECPIDTVYEWIEEVGVGGGIEASPDDYSPFDTINS